MDIFSRRSSSDQKDSPLRRVIICSNCSHQLSHTTLSCAHCGQSYRDKYIAALIALLLGVAGAHRFYLKSWVAGFGYLLASSIAVTTEPRALFAIALIAVVESVVFLSMNEPRWRRTYARSTT